jgi:hypothetical protein
VASVGAGAGASSIAIAPNAKTALRHERERQLGVAVQDGHHGLLSSLSPATVTSLLLTPSGTVVAGAGAWGIAART